MRTLAQSSANGNRVRPWLVLALLLAATVVGATDSAAGTFEPITPVTPITEPVAGAAEPVTGATAQVAHATESVAQAAEPVAHAAAPVAGAIESSRGGGRLRAQSVQPRIGRIFFSPAERRSRHGGGEPLSTSAGMTEAPTAPGSRRPPARNRLVVNGALSSSTHGRAVWVNGKAIENSARDKSAWTDRNGNVWLVNGEQGIRLIRPGQSIDRTGVIEDLLPPGAVTRR